MDSAPSWEYGVRIAVRNADHGRLACGLTVTAFVWALALVAGALLLPAYTGSSSSSGGGVVSTSNTSSTLAAQNGPGVLLLVALPVFVSVLVWSALHRKCSLGSRSSGQVAWLLIALLLAFAFVAIASIGLFVLPVALLLAAAASLTPAAP
ncbi:MAG: hypothetical protein ACR2KV_05010 [Solirubrobacteraceae bacterium]